MRWAPDARGRLERAALELFSEQGFSATTVPQITSRAGLTTRTFFRYFADKREVIFGGTSIQDAASTLIAEAPANLDSAQVIRHVLASLAASHFEGQKEQMAAWRAIINSNNELRDRDARKRADLILATRTALINRGETALAATLAAEVGVLVFQVALEEWTAQPGLRSMEASIERIFAALQSGSLFR